MRIRRMADTVWAWLGQDALLVPLLGLLLLSAFIPLLVPQSPVSARDGTAFVRWLAQLPSTFSTLRAPFAALGLLTWRSSVWIRLLYALLALSLAAQAEKLLQSWATLRLPARTFYILVCSGGLLILVGWGAQIILGWIEPDILAWPNTPCQIEARNITLPPQEPGLRLWTGRFGLFLLPESPAVGLTLQAQDKDAAPLLLSPSAQIEASPQLQISLSSQSPDGYFAIPQAGLVFRLSAILDDAALPVQMQVYRLASGELLAETDISESAEVSIEAVQVTAVYAILAHFQAVYNPGAPIQGLGMLFYATGAIRLKVLRQRARHEEETVVSSDMVDERQKEP